VLTTALDAGHTHGIGYWAATSKVKRNAKGEVTAFDVLDQGEAQKTLVTKTVRASDVEAAVLKMLHDGGKKTHCRGFLHQLLRFEVDGPLADAIMQVIVFGDVVYG
jgi:hypothetical protein